MDSTIALVLICLLCLIAFTYLTNNSNVDTKNKKYIHELEEDVLRQHASSSRQKALKHNSHSSYNYKTPRYKVRIYDV
jgi:uncharacterized protein YxeA